MLHDRLLFNRSLERGSGEGWTVDIYLDDLDVRYGGIDSVRFVLDEIDLIEADANAS